MIRRVLLASLLIYVSATAAAQSAPQIDSSSQPAVSALRTLAQTIEECPRVLSTERLWGKGPTEIERWYVGPPRNVVWDAVVSSSIRSPYTGYIEFLLPEDHWVPDEVKDKFVRSDAGTAYTLATAGGGPMRYRYEFDLGPEGLQLTRLLRHGQGSNGQYPSEWFDVTQKGDMCWENAARNAQLDSRKAKQAEGVGGDVALYVDIQDSGTAFVQVCSAVENAAAGPAKVAATGLCVGYLEGVLGGLDVAGTILKGEGKAGSSFLNQVAYCPAGGSSPSMIQLLRVVLKYTKDNPAKANLSPARLVVDALRQEFPCGTK